MAKLRYLIRRLSVQAKSVIMGGQEDTAIFFQAMCILNGSRAGKNSFPLLKNTYAFTILADTRSV